MAAKKRGLGRGLDALIGNVNQMPRDGGGASEADALRHIPVEFLQRGRYQPRREIGTEALQELAESIKAQGLMQPIVVRPIGPDRYEIIAGERRWRASQLAGLAEIPALVRDVPDEAAVAMALIENIQREDLNVVDEALALQRLQQEFGLTHEQVAGAVGKSRATISNLLRLLQLEPEARDLLEQGQIEMGHARALLALSDAAQVDAARRVAHQGLSVRETEALVRRLQHPPAPKPKPTPDADTRRLMQALSDKTGARVQLQHQASGRGKLTFSYNSLDELEGLLRHFDLEP
jgi:ParB family chromosome partitioning protein